MYCQQERSQSRMGNLIFKVHSSTMAVASFGKTDIMTTIAGNHKMGPNAPVVSRMHITNPAVDIQM